MRISRRAFALGLGLGAAGCSAPKFRDGKRILPFWFSYGGKNREVLLDLVAKFNARSTRYFVKATYQGDYFEALAKLRTAIAAGAAPAFSHVVAEVIPYLERAGTLETLRVDDADFVPALGQKGAYEGEHPLVAVPFNRSTPIMLVNGKLQDELRFEAPNTWDELSDVAQMLTTKDRWGYEVPISWWFWIALLGQAGGSIVENGDDPTLGGDAGVNALRFWQKLVHEKRVMRPPAGRDYNAWNATNQDFLAGRAAIIWTSTAFLRYLEENASFPVRAFPLPAMKRRSVPTGGTFFVVLRAAPDEEKEGAHEFLRFMCEPESTIEWATRTGYLPVTATAIARYPRKPNDDVAIAQLASAQPWPWIPDLFRIQREILEPRLEDAVYRKLDAGAVLAEARTIARRRK